MLQKFFYKNLVRPVLWQIDAETVHNLFTFFGEALENIYPEFLVKNERRVLGIKFSNPVGLSAGFDYDGHLAAVLGRVGFGFSTVGTVTARPYAGNPGPRLVRLPKSHSILVNKGFKSEGAAAVAARLDGKKINHALGISIGSSNLPGINTITKAINDYLSTFDAFKKKPYVKYFELNISCPNTAMTESFTKPKNFLELIKAVRADKPIFIKMPNEIAPADSDELVRLALKNNIRGFIFSNLVKKRGNPVFDKAEIAKYGPYTGNFSGWPTAANSKNLIAHTRQKFGRDVALISVGGIFTPEDALERLSLGADLIQLITGMIFEGPQLPGEITGYLVKCGGRQH